MQQQVYSIFNNEKKTGTIWWQTFSRSGVQGRQSDKDYWDVGVFFVALNHFDKPPGDTAGSQIISACYYFHKVQTIRFLGPIQNDNHQVFFTILEVWHSVKQFHECLNYYFYRLAMIQKLCKERYSEVRLKFWK